MSYWVSLVLSSGTVSAIITIVLNRKLLSRQHMYNIYANHRLEIVNKYLENMSLAVRIRQLTPDMGKYNSLILVYAPATLHDKIVELNRLLETAAGDPRASALLHEVSSALHEVVKVKRGGSE